MLPNFFINLTKLKMFDKKIKAAYNTKRKECFLRLIQISCYSVSKINIEKIIDRQSFNCLISIKSVSKINIEKIIDRQSFNCLTSIKSQKIMEAIVFFFRDS